MIAVSASVQLQICSSVAVKEFGSGNMLLAKLFALVLDRPDSKAKHRILRVLTFALISLTLTVSCSMNASQEEKRAKEFVDLMDSIFRSSIINEINKCKNCDEAEIQEVLRSGSGQLDYEQEVEDLVQRYFFPRQKIDALAFCESVGKIKETLFDKIECDYSKEKIEMKFLITMVVPKNTISKKEMRFPFISEIEIKTINNGTEIDSNSSRLRGFYI